MFEGFKNYFYKGDEPASKAWEEEKVDKTVEKEISPVQLAERVNIFISNYGVKVGPELVNPLLLKAGLSKENIGHMIGATYNQMPDNGLTVSANIAYLESLRLKIFETGETLDLVEKV